MVLKLKAWFSQNYFLTAPFLDSLEQQLDYADTSIASLDAVHKRKHTEITGVYSFIEISILFLFYFIFLFAYETLFLFLLELKKQIETLHNEIAELTDNSKIARQKEELLKEKIKLEQTVSEYSQKNVQLEKINTSLISKNNALEEALSKRKLNEEQQQQQQKRIKLEKEKSDTLASGSYEFSSFLLLWQFTSNTEQTAAALKLPESGTFVTGTIDKLVEYAKGHEIEKFEAIAGVVLSMTRISYSVILCFPDLIELKFNCFIL